MKRSLFRLLTIALSLLAISFFASALNAQGKGGGKGGGGNDGGGDNSAPVGYRIHWISNVEQGVPESTVGIWPQDIAIQTDADEKVVRAIVVGYYERTDRQELSAFVYEIKNPTNIADTAANRFIDITDLVGSVSPNMTWIDENNPLTTFRTVLRGVNSAGLAAGYVMDNNGVRHGIYLDLNEVDPVLELIPPPAGPFGRYEAVDVSASGFILIPYRVLTSDSHYHAYVFDPVSGLSQVVTEDTPEQIPIRLNNPLRGMHLNSSGIVLAETDLGGVIRHDLLNGTTTEFPDATYANGVNEQGEILVDMNLPVRKNRYTNHKARISLDNVIEWSSSANAGWYSQLNDQDDVFFATGGEYSYFNGSLATDYVFTDLIIPESDPNNWYTGNSITSMSNSDSTGFGWLATHEQQGMAILVPETKAP